MSVTSQITNSTKSNKIIMYLIFLKNFTFPILDKLGQRADFFVFYK